MMEIDGLSATCACACGGAASSAPARRASAARPLRPSERRWRVCPSRREGRAGLRSGQVLGRQPETDVPAGARPQAARGALPAIAASAGARCAPAIGKTAEAITLGSRLSALGSRLSALGSRLSALGSRLSALGSRLSALGSRLSKLLELYLSPRRTLHDTPEARKVPTPLFADEAHPPAADNQLSRFSMVMPALSANSVSAESSSAIRIVNSRELICVVGNKSK